MAPQLRLGLLFFLIKRDLFLKIVSLNINYIVILTLKLQLDSFIYNVFFILCFMQIYDIINISLIHGGSNMVTIVNIWLAILSTVLLLDTFCDLYQVIQLRKRIASLEARIPKLEDPE